MSDEDRITYLKDGLRPDFQKLLIGTKLYTVGDLIEAALEVEALDKRDYAPKLKYKSKTGCTKSSGIDPTAAVTSTSDSFCEHCLRPGHTKSD